ncbi:phage regulatory protein/antirepressor Ant [Macrococcus brunensis]|uniref:phage regulatory protein/antirepressor Ant n=1 Tax=Macrococcus brunensis TaxID=198483 RepID=UPI001EF0AB30|nr:phage regulatory protein/antirepressor Ant [Macrococcus brunensis]ULG72981.1 phage regulatory protein/antirepressor Ant [Macrococcus brunensis]
MFAPEVIKQLADQIVKEAVSMIEQQNRINQYPLIVNGKQAQEILGVSSATFNQFTHREDFQFVKMDGVASKYSRDVAQMIDKRHDHLIRDIKKYVAVLGDDPKLGSHQFFKSSTYINSQNKTQPCYLLTKKGCDMVANKMTGEKGILFTATYVNAFHEMEAALSTRQDSYMIADPVERAKRWIEEQEERKQLELTTKMQEQQLAELKPKVTYLDTILKSKSLVTIGQIAKDYGMSAQAMNKLLGSHRIQYKQSGQWLLYSQHHAKGYTHSETTEITRTDGRVDVVMHTKWTQKGRLFLYEFLKNRNVLPIIEQEESETA